MISDLDEISLNKVCRILLILPKLDVEKQYRQTYLRAILMIVLHICIFLATIYLKNTNIQQILVPSLYYIDLVYDVTAFLPVIASIVFLKLKNGRALQKMLMRLQNVDKQLHKMKDDYSPKVPWSFYKLAIFVHIFLIGFVGMDMFLWIYTLSYKLYLIVSYRDYESYHIITLAMALRHYALLIRRRFKAINDLLTDQTKKVDLEKVAEIYTDLTRTILEYNKIFGWQFVFLYLNILSNILLSISSSIVYSGGQTEIAGNTYGVDILMFSIFWGMLPILTASCIFTACESTTNEAKRTVIICYEIYQLTKSEQNKKQLLLLAQQASKLNLTFSAAGYFFINHENMFQLFGSVTSYLIVIIQFNK